MCQETSVSRTLDASSDGSSPRNQTLFCPLWAIAGGTGLGANDRIHGVALFWSSNMMFIRLQAYFDGVSNVERIADGEDIVFNGKVIAVTGRKIALADPMGRFHVYELTLKDSIRATNAQGFPPLVEVKAGIGKLMDWSPRTILRLAAQWSFLPTDNAKLCVLSPTCVTP